MDIVGDAIRALRIGEPRSARAYLYPPWGLRWDPSSGAGFNVHVVLQGAAWALPEGRDPIALHTGDVVFVARTIAYGIADSLTTPLVDVPVDPADYWFGKDADPAAAADATVVIGGSYYLDRQRVHPLLDTLPDVIVLPARIGMNDPIRATVQLLSNEHDGETAGSTAAIPALLDLLFTYVVRAVFETADTTTGWAAALRDRSLTTALHNIQSKPEITWTVASLARASGMSRAAFARRFTDVVGQPPLTYLTWWRMNLASQLLRETDLPLALVAQRVGYGSEFAFGKAFSRERGTAPGAYRRAAT
jgi:AraC-like DNA-binding protein